MNLSPEEMKALFKQAIKEWMTEQKRETEATVGRWVFRIGISALTFALAYFILIMNGWKRIGG